MSGQGDELPHAARTAYCFYMSLEWKSVLSKGISLLGVLIICSGNGKGVSTGLRALECEGHSI